MKRAIPAILILFLAACAPKVERISVDETKDLSGRWNDTDSRLVAEAMVADCLSSNWIERFMEESKGKRPTVIVGTVRNRSHEHINAQTFVKDLERALLNSGKVDFVASSEERREVREERRDQNIGYASPETAKEFGRETGADFMLKGVVNSIEDRIEGEKVILYQVNLELINIQTNRKVWIGEKKIKKYIERPPAGL